MVIILSQLSFLLLWSLDPDKRLDSYLLDQWEISDGLPSNTINSIVQTPDGYLWLAGSNGLVCFDGLKFSNVSFLGKEELSSPGHPEPFTLTVNREGVLWIGSTMGLTRFFNGRFKTFTTEDGLSENSIRRIAVDMKGNLWISFKAGYLDLFSNEKFIHFNPSHGLEGKKINAIVEDRGGNLLFATREKGIFSFREGRFSPYPIPGLDNSHIITMYRDHNQDLWIGTTKGLLRVGEKGTIRYRSRHGLSNDYIIVIKEDSEQNLWIGTLKGLNRLKRKNDGNIVFESLLYPAVIFCLYEDREKSLWIGTDNSGLKRLKESKFTTYAAPKALQEETVISIFRDRGGDTWIGSLGGKLFHFRENRLIETIEPPLLSGTGISDIAEDSEGNLWLGTIGRGVFKKTNKSFVPFTTKQELTDNLVTSICEDTRGHLWFGTYAGVSIIRGPGSEVERFTAREGLAGKVVHNIYEDKSGGIWIAADQGITVLNKGKTTAENIKHYMQGIPVVSIYEDPSPTRGEEPISWITTNGFGLKRLKSTDGTFYSYTDKQGMTSNSLYQFFEEHGNFWLMSNKGILRVSKGELNQLAEKGTGKINCTSFGRAEGMPSTEFHNELSGNSALKTDDGELWFVTKKGIAILNPGKLRINKEPPPVVIETALFDDRSFNLLRNENYRFKGIKKVEFRFTALSFLSPEKIRFKYQLEGFTKGWEFLPPGKERVVRFLDLEPGTYTFRVTACNAEGIWNPTGASVTFTLESFFYETLFFKIAFLVLFTALTAVMLYLYKKNPPARRAIKSFDQTFTKVWPPAGPPEKEKEKYKSSNLTPEFANECERRVKHLMEVEKIYRDENISLQSLAEKVRTKPYILSQVLNERMNRNFHDLINYYRIEEAKQILACSRGEYLKMAALAGEVGFNTTAAFHKVFKKHTGMTPIEYQKEVKKTGR